MSASTAEYNNIEERVSTKTVGPVYRHASSFASSVETRDNRVFAILRSKHSEQYLNERREDEQTLSTVKTSPVYLVGIPPTAKEELEACIERLEIFLTVVMNRWQDWDWLLRDIDTREDCSRF